MSPDFDNDRKIKTGNGFKKLGFSDLLVDEIIASTIRVNYGQDLMVHKFVGEFICLFVVLSITIFIGISLKVCSIIFCNLYAGSVSVAGAIGNLWSVDGGNFRVAEKLLESSDAQLVRDRVVKVSTASDGKFMVRRQGTSTESDKSDLSRVSFKTSFVFYSIKTVNHALTVLFSSHSRPMILWSLLHHSKPIRTRALTSQNTLIKVGLVLTIILSAQSFKGH